MSLRDSINSKTTYKKTNSEICYKYSFNIRHILFLVETVNLSKTLYEDIKCCCCYIGNKLSKDISAKILFYLINNICY